MQLDTWLIYFAAALGLSLSPGPNGLLALTHGALHGRRKTLWTIFGGSFGFIAVIACLDWILLSIGHLFSPDFNLTLNWIFGKIFYPMAWAMGVPSADINNVATLLGQKLTINEFVAFQNLTNHSVPITTDKGLLILSIAICGFANFSSVGMQIGGIGALAPERRTDLAKLGLKALLCGTLASYLSATLAGIVV